MQFQQFKQIHQQHVATVLNDTRQLYTTDVDPNELWELYLNSFPQGVNKMYRKRREFDCSCCKAFIRQLGNVVAIVDNKPVSIWDFETNSDIYQSVVDTLAHFVKSAPIKDYFITKQAGFGADFNHQQLDSGNILTWHHFRIDLPSEFVTRSHDSEAAIAGKMKATRQVFQRSLEEISRDAVETVLDLIAEGALYKGDEWQGVLVKFLELQTVEYHTLPDSEKDNYCWVKSAETGGAVGRIKNHSIGVLLQDLTDGTDVIDAVRKYEHIVAPQNYKRPKPIFTKQMVEQAQATVERLGLIDSLGRRHAKLDDIIVNNTVWSNRDAAKHMRNGSVVGVFEMLKSEVAVNPRQFERMPGIGIDDFIKDILPTATSVEILLENRHQASLVSLIAPQVTDSSTLFKWDNGFSWAYSGNVADSMKARVKAAGGSVDGVLRFSLQWNDGDNNQNDFDAHCIEPRDGSHIYYSNARRVHPSSGVLDVDIINPGRNVAVENITWSNLHRMPEGEYSLFVRNYSHNGGRTGFAAEIEFNSQIHEYEYDKELAHKEDVQVALVQYTKREGFKITQSLPSTTSSKAVWNLTTNQFHPVSIVTHSPNYWNGQRGIGHKHTFFMLAGCVNSDQPNGFYNEYLKEDFMQYKRVFAALGSKMKVERTSDQLSGVGFSSTKRNSLICKVDGKVVKIVF